MAVRYNVSSIQSEPAPAASVGQVPSWGSAWSVQTGGDLFRTFPLSRVPSALSLGERVSIDAQTLYIVRAARTGRLVAGVRITAGGSSYNSAPSVSFSGGGGSGAAGTALISSGAVTGVLITDPGQGYTGVPNVSFSGGGGSGAGGTPVLAGHETDEGAAQSLIGDTAVAWWIKLHTGDPGTNGSANEVNIARFEQDSTNWTTP